MNPPALLEECAARLSAGAGQPAQIKAFVGFDGFVDEILHVVDKRETAEIYHRMPTIAHLAERLAGAAGQSTNVELVRQRTKLGGNGPIMAHALATLGLRVTYVGNLGVPTLHPVFNALAALADVYSIADPGHTDALEFEDGKVMLGKHSSLKDITWANILARVGRERLQELLAGADFAAFVNWTMIPHMSEIWEALLHEVFPNLGGARRTIFFDLADPEKRPADDLRDALKLISRFQKHCNVVLGLNEKEAYEVAEVLGVGNRDHSATGVSQLAQAVHAELGIDTLAVHPTSYAVAVSQGQADVAEGPHVPHPVITTGAGDHFNAGFCLGKLLGFRNGLCVMLAVATSGYYVKTGQSPDVPSLIALLRDWPRRPE